MKENYKEPLYPIGIAAKLLGVCQATLRIWERKGLIKPVRLGKNRFYSKCDLDRLEQIKELIQKRHINIEGVKAILSTTHCWEIKKCSVEERESCPVYRKYAPAVLIDIAEGAPNNL
jgi:MerR family transcriptional regulator/heat shock protein HspR